MNRTAYRLAGIRSRRNHI